MHKTVWLVLGVGTCVFLGTQLNRCLTCQPEQKFTVNANLRLEGAAFLTKDDVRVVAGPRATEPIPGPTLPEVPNVAEGVGLAGGTDGDAPVESDKSAEPVRKVAHKDDEEHKDDGKKLSLTFDKLASYDYKFPDIGAEEKDTGQIPPSVRKLEGRTIDIRGFMIPMRNDGDDVLEFVLVRNQAACCFGVYPKMNEWIHVTMVPGKTAPFAIDIPITVHGKLRVGEVWENGVVMSLYRLECTKVDEPPVYR